MVVRVVEIIKEAARLLGIKEIVNDINNKVYESEEIDNMLMAVNMVNNNIASNYIELIYTKDVSSINDVIPFNSICEDGIISIKSVVEKLGTVKKKFSIKGDGVHVESGFYTVEYSCFPKTLEIGSYIDCYTKINCNLFALGVVSEYLFLKGDIEEAYIWDKRFKQSLLSVLKTNKKPFIMPRRRWS